MTDDDADVGAEDGAGEAGAGMKMRGCRQRPSQGEHACEQQHTVGAAQPARGGQTARGGGWSDHNQADEEQVLQPVRERKPAQR